MIRQRKKQPTWRSAAAHRLRKLAGDPSSVEEAVRLVAQQLVKGVKQAPTDLDAIAKRLDVTWGEDEPDAVHQLLMFEGTWEDVSKPEGSEEARRFLKARRLAQAVFERTGQRGLRGAELERLCDMLAIELLLPGDEIQEDFRENISIQHAISLAKTYGVTFRMAAHRLSAESSVSMFAVEGQQMVWACGRARSGPVSRCAPELGEAIQHAMWTPFEEPVSFFSSARPWFGSWLLEWAHVSESQTLFLVRLTRRDERQKERRKAFRESIALSMGLRLPMDDVEN